MRAKLDENVPVGTAASLVSMGWDCETVYQEDLSGCSDEEIAKACQRERRILVTFDKDFGERRFEQFLSASGLILLRLPTQSITEVVDRIVAAAGELQGQTTPPGFVVVDQNRIRRGRWIGPS